MCLVEWISIHSELMWTIPFGDRSIGKRLKKIYRKNVFVTTPVTFYFNFTKNHDFDDLGKAVMIWGGIFWIWCVQTVRGWWVDAQGYLKRALMSPRSALMFITVLKIILQSVVLKVLVADQIQTYMVGVNELYRPSPNLIFHKKKHNSTFLIVRITLYQLKTRSQITLFHHRTYILQIMIWHHQNMLIRSYLSL